jgi:hypothetical protein
MVITQFFQLLHPQAAVLLQVKTQEMEHLPVQAVAAAVAFQDRLIPAMVIHHQLHLAKVMMAVLVNLETQAVAAVAPVPQAIVLLVAAEQAEQVHLLQ